MTCRIEKAIDCDPFSNCIEGDPQDINLPPILKIDLKQKTISGARSDGKEEHTTFGRGIDDADQYTLYGYEKGKGWSMNILKKGGRMTLAVSGPSAGFLIFGVCEMPR